MITHENIEGVSASCSLPSSQNTAGLVARKKNTGMSGKKNPSRMPLWRDDTAGCEFASEALLPPSRESIHCSSSARACSSTSRRCVSADVTNAEQSTGTYNRPGRQTLGPGSLPPSVHEIATLCWQCPAPRTQPLRVDRSHAAA